MSDIIRQYENSPILSEIINKAVGNILPVSDIDNLYSSVMDIYSAHGFALDIWGRIVGIDRSIPDDVTPVFFGFDGATGSEGFDIAPFGY